tara:strand:+ start:2148 stop:3050 length:903 start_codon:yes stop_codon:yes gene_type:complete
MKCKVTNNSDMNIDELSPLIDDLASHIQGVMDISSMPAITLQEDSDNASAILGKTAQYDPQNKVITVFVTNRHPKDIMRSISHEFIHHAQNERGEFDNIGAVGEGYAQSDDHLRNMEKEAYLKGNMCFRDWEDGYKRQLMESIHRQNSFKRRNNTMKIHNWKNNELNRLLMEKFNFGTNTILEGDCSGNREDEEEEQEAVNEDMGKAEEELKAKIKQAEDEGDEKKAEELRKQLQQMGGAMEEAAKPDFLDLDGDGDKKEPMKKASADKKAGKKDDDKEKQEESFRNQVRAKLEEILNIK